MIRATARERALFCGAARTGAGGSAPAEEFEPRTLSYEDDGDDAHGEDGDEEDHDDDEHHDDDDVGDGDDDDDDDDVDDDDGDDDDDDGGVVRAREAAGPTNLMAVAVDDDHDQAYLAMPQRLAYGDGGG